MFAYRILVEWSAEDDAFVARVPAFRFLAAHGGTPGQAADEAVTATKLMVESLEAEGKPVPPSDVAADFSGTLTVRTSKSMHADLSRLSSMEGESMNQLVDEILSEGLARRRSPKVFMLKDEDHKPAKTTAKARGIRRTTRD